MAREFQNGNGLVTAPALNAKAVTPSDTVDLAQTARGIYCGVGGDVKLITLHGDTVTFTNLAAGVIHPISAARIYATGTTATGIVAVY